MTFDDVRSFAAIFQSLETCYNLKVPLQRFVSHGETIQFVHVSPHCPAVWKFNRSWGCLSLSFGVERYNKNEPMVANHVPKRKFIL